MPKLNVMAGHFHTQRRPGGFTMVELIIVIVLVGVISAFAAARFFDRRGFDADAFAEQSRTMLRFAQKLAVAQNREVYVLIEGNRLALCYDKPSSGCRTGDQVEAPSGSNSGSAATTTHCQSGSWYCEGRPDGLAYTTSPSVGFFHFDALGRPGLSSGNFAGLKLTITGDGSSRAISIEQETGYVH